METEESARLLDELRQRLEEQDLPALRERLPRTHPADLAAVLRDLPIADEVTLFRQLAREQAGAVLSAMDDERLLALGQALDHLRKSATKEGVFYVYVVDDHDHLVGVVPLRRLITADPTTSIAAIRRPDVISVTADTDQEEVARLVTKHNLLAVPVVSRDNRLLGTITVDDVIDVIHEEATEDIHRLAGVAGDETIFDPPAKAVRRRFVWLLIHLPTA